MAQALTQTQTPRSNAIALCGMTPCSAAESHKLTKTQTQTQTMDNGPWIDSGWSWSAGIGLEGSGIKIGMDTDHRLRYKVDMVKVLLANGTGYGTTSLSRIRNVVM